MAENKTYSEKLRDPRWQKKRLEILNRDEFRCQMCLDEKTTLNVHHHDYKQGREPWEYDNDMLITYCEVCHKSETDKRHDLEMQILQLLKEVKTNSYHLHDFIFYLKKAEDVCMDIHDLCTREVMKIKHENEMKNK